MRFCVECGEDSAGRFCSDQCRDDWNLVDRIGRLGFGDAGWRFLTWLVDYTTRPTPEKTS